MGNEEFRYEHLKMVKPLGIQQIDVSKGYFTDYLIPQNNFKKLEEKLDLLSCKVRRLENENPHFADSYSAVKFCKLCSQEEKLDIIQAGVDDYATFYGFPRELYHFNIILSIEPEKAQKLLKKYLRKFKNNLEKKCLEGLAEPKQILWDGHFHDEEGKIDGERNKLYSFLEKLDVIKKNYTPFFLNDKDYDFRLCSKHTAAKYLTDIIDDLKKKGAATFREYGLRLKKDEINLGCKKDKIFTLGSN